MGRALLVVAISILGAASAAAQPAPDDPVIAEVDPAEARSGEVVEVSGSGWAPETRVEITHRQRPVGFATVSADGTWAEGVRVPTVDAPETIVFVVGGTSVAGEDTTFEITLEVETGTPRGTWIVVGVVAAIVLLVLVLGWSMLVRQRRASLAQRAAEGGTPVRNPDPRKEPQPHDDHG